MVDKIYIYVYIYKFSTSIHVLNNIECLITYYQKYPAIIWFSYTYITYENRKFYIEVWGISIQYVNTSIQNWILYTTQNWIFVHIILSYKHLISHFENYISRFFYIRARVYTLGHFLFYVKLNDALSIGYYYINIAILIIILFQ